jgi:hypothetical protein
MTRPLSLTIAVVLQWIAAILGLFGGLFLLSGAGAMASKTVREQVNQALADSGFESVTAATIAWGVLAAGVFAIVISVLRIIIAISLGRGHNWARILLTVFVALSLLSAVFELFQGGGAFWRGLGAIVVEIVILWLMWNRSSSAYIKVKTAERALAKQA